jgi:hypothetical protein
LMLIQMISSMTYLKKQAGNSISFDPESMHPKGESAAVEEALKLHRELAKYNHPASGPRCVSFSRRMCKGELYLPMGPPCQLPSVRWSWLPRPATYPHHLCTATESR